MVPLQQILDRLPAERRAYVEARARELIAETALTGALAPIVLLSPGERPTEPGWYVARLAHGSEIIRVRQTDGRLSGWYPDHGGSFALERYDFIARIYPDRIEGREG